MIVLQEPSIKKVTLGTYRPKGYKLCMQPALETEVAFLVSKKIGDTFWSNIWHSYQVAEISLRISTFLTRIINVYSSTTSAPELIGLYHIIYSVKNHGSNCPLVGDLNFHHPVRGGAYIKRDMRAQHLLKITSQAGLHLATPMGRSTFRRKAAYEVLKEAVFDLNFATEDILARIQSYQTREYWSIQLDYTPMEISIRSENMLRNEAK